MTARRALAWAALTVWMLAMAVAVLVINHEPGGLW